MESRGDDDYFFKGGDVVAEEVSAPETSTRWFTMSIAAGPIAMILHGMLKLQIGVIVIFGAILAAIATAVEKIKGKGNLLVSITNVHVRYKEFKRTSYHPFSLGVAVKSADVILKGGTMFLQMQITDADFYLNKDNILQLAVLAPQPSNMDLKDGSRSGSKTESSFLHMKTLEKTLVVTLSNWKHYEVEGSIAAYVHVSNAGVSKWEPVVESFDGSITWSEGLEAMPSQEGKWVCRIKAKELVNISLTAALVNAIRSWQQQNDSRGDSSNPDGNSTLEKTSSGTVKVNLAKLGISIVDDMPQELLYVTSKDLCVKYDTRTRGYEISSDDLQVDNQLKGTPVDFQVLFHVRRDVDSGSENFLKLTRTEETNVGDPNPVTLIKSTIASKAVLVLRHQNLILELLLNMIRKLSSTCAESTKVPSVDHVTCFEFGDPESKNPMQLEITAVPSTSTQLLLRDVSSLTMLVAWDKVPIVIKPFKFCNRKLTWLDMFSRILFMITCTDIWTNVLKLSFSQGKNVPQVGSALSSRVANEIAALNKNDDKYAFAREKDMAKDVKSVGDGLLQGLVVLGKAYFSAYAGMLTKPVRGLVDPSSGGFIDDVCKAVASGTVKIVCAHIDSSARVWKGISQPKKSPIDFKNQPQRIRLPRYIGADKVLPAFDEQQAKGQDIMYSAQQLQGLETYVHHFILSGQPSRTWRERCLLITSRRIILLQLNEQANPKCEWHVHWDEYKFNKISGRDLFVHTRLFYSRRKHVESDSTPEISAAIDRAYENYGTKQ